MNHNDADKQRLFLMQQTFATLFSVVNKLQGVGDSNLSLLTSRQLMAMIAIGHLEEGEASINNVASKLGTTKQSARQLVSALAEKGYVQVTIHHEDRRSVDIRFTKAGLSAMEVDGRAGTKLFQTIFKAFSLEELNLFWGLLKKLYAFDGMLQDGFEAEKNLFEGKGE